MHQAQINVKRYYVETKIEVKSVVHINFDISS